MTTTTTKQLSLDAVEIAKAAGFSDRDIEQLEDGKLIQGVLDSTNEREIAAKLGAKVNAPPNELMEIFLSSSQRLKNDPSAHQLGSMDDLTSLKLEPGRAAITKEYLKAADASSDLNLSKSEMAEFQALSSLRNEDASCRVEEKLREILLRRYESYTQSGLYEPGPELAHKSQLSVVLKKFAPVFYKYLNEYPQSKPDQVDEAFTWVNFTIDDMPSVALVHKFGMMENGAYVFCQRHFYVSRGHNSVQAIGGAFPQQDDHNHDSTVVVLYGSRASTDRVAGFGGAAKRAMGARIMGGKVADNLRTVRDKYNNNNQ